MTDLTRRLRYELSNRADLNLLVQMRDGEFFSLAPHLQAMGFLPTPAWKTTIRDFENRFWPMKRPIDKDAPRG